MKLVIFHVIEWLGCVGGDGKSIKKFFSFRTLLSYYIRQNYGSHIISQKMRVVNLTGPTKLVKEKETRSIKEVFVIYPQYSLFNKRNIF